MASMPSGREIHSMKSFTPPALDASDLERMRAPPNRTDDFEGTSSEEDGEEQDPVGAFPGTKGDYASSSTYY
jgi:hypothetical protein